MHTLSPGLVSVLLIALSVTLAGATSPKGRGFMPCNDTERVREVTNTDQLAHALPVRAADKKRERTNPLPF